MYYISSLRTHVVKYNQHSRENYFRWFEQFSYINPNRHVTSREVTPQSLSRLLTPLKGKVIRPACSIPNIAEFLMSRPATLLSVRWKSRSEWWFSGEHLILPSTPVQNNSWNSWSRLPDWKKRFMRWISQSPHILIIKSSEIGIYTWVQLSMFTSSNIVLHV